LSNPFLEKREANPFLEKREAKNPLLNKYFFRKSEEGYKGLFE
jgi:hypothetical protein